MRRSAVPEPRVPLSRNIIADRSDEADHLSNSDEEDKAAFPEDTWAAWTCLLGSFLMMFPSFGFQTAGKELAGIQSLVLIIKTNFVQLDRSRITSILISLLIIASAMSDGSQLCLCS